MRIERREHKRYYLSKDQRIPLELSLSHHTLDVRLLNISKSGIAVAIAKKHQDLILKNKSKTDFRITSVTDKQFHFLKDKKFRIRWVLNTDSLKNMGAGCEFTNMDTDSKNHLDALFSEKNNVIVNCY